MTLILDYDQGFEASSAYEYKSVKYPVSGRLPAGIQVHNVAIYYKTARYKMVRCYLPSR